MILVDANLPIYAYNPDSRLHDAARAWLEEIVNSDEEVRFALITLLAFIRLTTSPAVFPKPLQVEKAIEIATGWLRQPNVGIASPTVRHWSLLEGLSRSGQARGPLLIDAHLAALALEHGATLCTTDRDFARFPGLRFTNPLDSP